MTDSRYEFFQSLFDSSIDLIASFPLTIEPAGMAHIVDVLEPKVKAATGRNPFVNPAGVIDADDNGASRASAGLNTVGMLLDRLSILAIKHWNLRHRAEAPEKAEALVRGQIEELLRALAEARAGESSINNKMTNRHVDVATADFAAAFYGLQTINLLLWEAQEILYNHDISVLPCEELRAYIDFFSRGNIARNMYIQASDETYWSASAR